MACEQVTRRRIERRFTQAGQVPTVPIVADHCTPGWLPTDIYKGEIVINTADGKVFTRVDSGIIEIGSGGGDVSIGQAVVGGSPGAILFIDAAGNIAQDVSGNDSLSRDNATGNIVIGGAPAAATHKLTVLEAGANGMYVEAFPNTGATARIEVGADLLGHTGVNGIVYAYLTPSGDSLSTVVGEQYGINAIRSGYDSLNGNSQNIFIATDYIQVLSLDTALGNIPIGMAVMDRASDGGVVVQGKGTGNEVAFRVKQGSYPNLFSGNDVFKVNCQGTVEIPSLGGSGNGIVGVDNSGVLSFTSYQSIGANLIIDDINYNIYTRNANPPISGGSDIILIGSQASVVNPGSTASATIIGNFSTGDAVSIVIGSGAFGGVNSVAIGHNIVAADNAIAISGFAWNPDSIAIFGDTSDSNQMVVGGTIAITDIYYGNGVINNSPQSFTINATGGNGTNSPGASAIIAGGIATGIGDGGDVRIRTSVPGSSGSAQQLLGDRLNIKGKYINLINSTPTTVSTVNIPDGTVAGGSVNYTIEATDATDFQALTGSVIWSAVNKAGALTISFDDDQQTSSATTTGTLTSVATVVDGGGGNLEIKLTVTSSLVGATIRVSFIHWKNFGKGDIM